MRGVEVCDLDNEGGAGTGGLTRCAGPGGGTWWWWWWKAVEKERGEGGREEVRREKQTEGRGEADQEREESR